MKHVAIESSGETTVVRISRPPANALERELGSELIEIAAGLRESPPRAVVLTGSGGFFSAGLDLKAIPALDPADQSEMVMGVNRLVAGWSCLPCPLVCAVSGHAIAGGLVLALCGDYRVGSTSGKLGLTEVRVGVPYPAAAIAIVRSELSPPAARVLTLQGNLVEPPEALALGLVDELAPPDEVVERALAVAAELAAAPADTYATVKRQLRAELIGELERIVTAGEDPLLGSWLSEETEGAASRALGKSA